jgi:pseudouridylate synthase
MRRYLDVRPEVADAVAAGRPVVVLESTVIAHGLPRPRNFEAARLMEAAVREQGAVPATIGLLDGQAVVGLSVSEVERLATAPSVAKVSSRDLASVLAGKALGATTVAGTAVIAAQVGLRVLATGGIGGVHRNWRDTFDVSNDLWELARTPVAVICSGAKVILDLPRTLEMLETLGVPAVGYRTDEFPAFYARESGLALQVRVDTPEEAARLLAAHLELELGAAVVICNPPPRESALSRSEIEGMIEGAMESAARAGITGKAVTPYLLDALAKASVGRTLNTNMALLENNARLAAQIAVAAARSSCQDR